MNRRLLPLMSLCLAILLGFALPTSAGPGVWTTAGPDGGQVNVLARDPFSANTLYAGGRGGLYKTTNEGLSWTRLGGGLATIFIVDVAADPLVANRVFAISANTLYRSTDGGSSWAVAIAGLPASFVPQKIVMDSSVADQLYLAGLDGGVFRSTTGGNSWLPANSGLPPHMRTLAIDPSNNLHLLAGIDNNTPAPASSMFESTDGGATWLPVTGPWDAANSEAILSIVFGSGTSQVFAGSNYGRFASSSNNGATWPTEVFLGGEVRHIAPHPTISPDVFVALGNGLQFSNDGGSSFTESSTGITSDGTVQNGVSDIEFRNGSSTVMYAAADYSGFYRSGNTGSTWATRNSGMSHTNIRAVAVNPLAPSNVLAGYGDVFGTPSPAIYSSATSGASWSVSNGGLGAMQIRDIKVDPNTGAVPGSAVVYAVGRRDPIFTSDSLTFDGDGGIYKSTDGGINWSTIDSGIPFFGFMPPSPDRSKFGTVRAIAFDLNSGLAGTGPLQTVFVSGSGRITYDAMNVGTIEAARVYRSDDAGATWFAADGGLPIPPTTTGPSPDFIQIGIPIVAHPGPPLTLYMGTFISVFNVAAGSPTFANGVFKSIDGGVSWVHSSNGLPRLDAGPSTSHINVLALAVDPTNANTVYAAASGDDFVGRIYKSIDGGANWVESSTGLTLTQDFRALLINPADPNMIFATSGGAAFNPGGVFRSVDAGATWQSISIGLPDAVTAVDIDNSGLDPLLHAGSTAGVYSMTLLPDDDTDGPGDMTEAGAPNGGDGNDDGMQDANQVNVASLPGDPVPNGGNRGGNRGGNGNYVTVVLVPITGNCANLVNVHSVAASELPVDGSYTYPHGIIQFEIPDCTSAQVEIIYHDGDFFDAYQFRNYGPTVPGDSNTVRWYDYTANTTINGVSWIVDVDDGQFGDIRPANGTILFRGGPGFADLLFADGLEN